MPYDLSKKFNLMSYITKFYCKATIGLLRPHQVVIPEEKPSYQFQYVLSEKVKNKWLRLFNAPDETKAVPFTYISPIFVTTYLNILLKLKINYKNILHLRNEQEFIAAVNRWIEVNEKCTVNITLDDIVYICGHRISLVFYAEIKNEKNEILTKVKDLIFVKHVPEQSLEKLKSSKIFGKYPIEKISQLSQRKSGFIYKNLKKNPITIPPHMGKKYGIISGDLNPVHTSKIAVKLFGYSKRFIQGICTLNFLLKAFIYDKNEKLNSISMTFCNPIYSNQVIYLLVDNDDFELVDKSGTLLVFGTRTISH